MKLSTRTQYGLRMLCQLAIEHDKGSIQMNEIGEREGISEKYLGQIMLILKSAGLVSSVRGAQGGYYLSRHPDAIALAEVFEVLEGEILDFDEGTSGNAPGTASASKDMRLAASEVWKRVRDAVREVLGRYSLSDVVRLGLYKSGYLDYRI